MTIQWRVLIRTISIPPSIKIKKMSRDSLVSMANLTHRSELNLGTCLEIKIRNSDCHGTCLEIKIRNSDCHGYVHGILMSWFEVMKNWVEIGEVTTRCNSSRMQLMSVVLLILGIQAQNLHGANTTVMGIRFGKD